jgi:RHS repeat-associated protein
LICFSAGPVKWSVKRRVEAETLAHDVTNIIFYYHNDLNGCPTRLTTTSGQIVWSASYTAWGEIATLHANLVIQPIRLQGQQEDAETRLHYNRYRYYSAEASTFVSADPLGMAAGDSLYGYAYNSLGYVDPLGLTSSPSQILASNMAAAGNPVPANYAAHHLIPTSKVGGSSLIQEAIRRGIYDPNQASNGLALPMDPNESVRTGRPLHSGRHLSDYFDVAEDRLNQAASKLGSVTAATDAQILSKIRAIERLMKMDLAADRLRLQSTDIRPAGTICRL